MSTQSNNFDIEKLKKQIKQKFRNSFFLQIFLGSIALIIVYCMYIYWYQGPPEWIWNILLPFIISYIIPLYSWYSGDQKQDYLQNLMEQNLKY